MQERTLRDLVETLSDRLTPEEIYLFRERIDNLSIDSRFICELVFNSPMEFATILMCKSPKEARSEIARFLREEKGWVWSRIWDSFREIKLTLKGD